ncbi:hypothetical protein H2201_009238 [Coniosporium apollinis]|uniref:Uncharacterized protein n=2 Tax=Coniosporium TaxID=2810619 RepID=A0ABQ9NGQ3_9PEZI|nr:hypothetical protein H2199_009248 [Cladosporium sp. JES 115]KAJ9652204.1 hypothetical protein H2201_009238 [Coniosporium apollinis]
MSRIDIENMDGKVMEPGFVNSKELKKLISKFTTKIPDFPELDQIAHCADGDMDTRVREYIDIVIRRHNIDTPPPMPKRRLSEGKKKELEAEGGKFKGRIKPYLKWSISILCDPNKFAREIVIYADTGKSSTAFEVFHCIKENGTWRKVPVTTT